VLNAAQVKAHSAIEVGQGALNSRQGGVDVAHQLIDEAADVLALALDAKVRLPSRSPSARS
jgi:cysteinyl-tRNA synthetase